MRGEHESGLTLTNVGDKLGDTVGDNDGDTFGDNDGDNVGEFCTRKSQES